MNAIVLIAAMTCGQTFVVTNKMPKTFVVANKCDDPFCELHKKLAEAKAKPFAMKTQTVTTRAPQGHTHTCPRCGTTWDHAANAGHNCPNCGTPQYVIDRTPRPVTVRRTIQVPVVTQPVSRPTPPANVTLSALQRSNTVYQSCGPSG